MRCEWIEEMLNVEYSPPRGGGEAAASTKLPKRRRRARSASAIARSLNSGQVGESSGLNSSAELPLRLRPIGLALRATPARRFGTDPFLFMARPPLLCEEGNSLREFNSFTPFSRSKIR